MRTAIFSNKGGVGKSSIATNLAVANSLKFKEKTLLVDVDGQANSTYSLLDPSRVDHGIEEVFMGEKSIQDIMIKVEENLWIVPATPKMNQLEMHVLTNKDKYPDYLNLLDINTEEFGEVFLDCPPSAGIITANVLSISDSVCIPFVPESYSVWGLMAVIEMIEEAKEFTNPDLFLNGIIASRVDRRIKSHNKIMRECREFCESENHTLFQTVIYNHSKFAEALDEVGKPAFLAAQEDRKYNTDRVKSIFDLLKEIKNKNHQFKEEENNGNV